MGDISPDIAKRRAWTYWSVALVFAVGYFAVRGQDWVADAGSHTLLETLSAVVALIVGAISLVGYYSRQDATSLFVGVAFLGAGILDGYHAVVTAPFFAFRFPSVPEFLIPESWTASRFFLALMMWLACVGWRSDRMATAGARLDERRVYAIGGLVAVACFLFFAFVPPPAVHYPDLIVPRPEELVAALFFLLALMGYLRKGRWRYERFEHWVVLSLIVGFFTQTGLMAHSRALFDPMFETAHVTKLVSYACVLIGSLARISHTVRIAEDGHRRFRSAIDAMDDGLSIWSADDRLLAFNEKFGELMGGTAGAPEPGMSLYELLLQNARNGAYGEGDPQAQANARYKRCVGGESAVTEFVTFEGKGSYEVLRNRMPDGSRVTIHRNVTDRVVAEERLFHIVENLAEAFVLWDPQDRLVLANKRFRGLNAEISEFTQPGTKYEDYIRALGRAGLVPEAAADMTGWMNHRLAEHRNPGGVYEVERQDNQWFLVHKQRLPDGSTASVATDITELKRAEVRVREREQRLKTIVDNVVDGIVTFDKRGIMLSANPAAGRMFRCSVEELLDRQVGELLVSESEEGPSALSRFVGPSIDTMGDVRELTGCRRDGEVFPMEVAVTKVMAGFETFYVCILRDISTRRDMDRMKNEFVSTVSHELRTPLTSIRGSLGLVVAGAVGELPAQARELVEIAERNSNRLIGLVNDILDMEKIESGRMDYLFQEVPIADIVSQSMDENEGYAEEHDVTFEVSDESADAIVRVDTVRLAQVMANLLSNAAKFSPREGVVKIDIRLHGMKVRVSVADNGPGIPDEYKARIFDKFTPIDSSDTRKAGGTGLGLSITRAILERHGGEIAFESEEGKGTTFWFELPVIDQPSREKADIDAAKASVLVCEDDADVARLMAAVLGKSGYDVTVARTAQDAKRLVRAREFDAMTVGLRLPDQNGITMIRELRDQGVGDLPIVIVSATADDVREKVCAACLPIADWLTKPIDDGKLSAVLDEAVRHARGAGVTILHVEDDDDLCRIIGSLFPDDVAVVRAASLREARKALRGRVFDLMILDVGLPDGSGLDLLPQLKSNGHAATPVLMLSGKEVDDAIAAETDAALTRSTTSNDELLKVIQLLIDRSRTLSNNLPRPIP